MMNSSGVLTIFRTGWPAMSFAARVRPIFLGNHAEVVDCAVDHEGQLRGRRGHTESRARQIIRFLRTGSLRLAAEPPGGLTLRRACDGGWRILSARRTPPRGCLRARV